MAKQRKMTRTILSGSYRPTPIAAFAIKLVVLGILLPGTAFATSPYDDYEDERPTIFDQGRSHGSVLIGSGSSDQGEFHLIVGAGYGYFIADGLDLRFDADMTLGRDPFVARTTPGLQYVFYFIPGIQPYVGGFVRHWFIGSGEDDMDSVGARLGGIFVQGAQTYIQVGAVWEKIVKNCRPGDKCSYVIPEIMISLAF